MNNKCPNCGNKWNKIYCRRCSYPNILSDGGGDLNETQKEDRYSQKANNHKAKDCQEKKETLKPQVGLAGILIFIFLCLSPTVQSDWVRPLNVTYLNSTLNYFVGNASLSDYVKYTDNSQNINDPNLNMTVGGITSKGQINKIGLYGEGNVRMGNYMDSGGEWGTTCFETDLTGIGGANSIWCIDNGGNDLRFYNPVTDEVTLRIFNNTVRIGDASHPRDMKIYGNLNGTGNFTMSNYYGGMYIYNASGITSTFNATYQKVYFDESHNNNGFTFSDSTLTLNDDGGMYQAEWIATGTGTNNHIYNGFVYVNEEQITNTIGHAIGTGNNQINMHGLGFIRIKAGDKITVRIADETSTSLGTQISANLNLVRVGN